MLDVLDVLYGLYGHDVLYGRDGGKRPETTVTCPAGCGPCAARTPPPIRPDHPAGSAVASGGA
ncbi:hypothetical protein [Actinacidiphila yeochonensis]|uniref:hypothetical protein n=1 Tax=Actinacidiphila yeochonensis TaxID=89050 RepID=UPI0012FEF855|nr:hypothetical protein [Actinacidiphila yeochonensis]